MFLDANENGIWDDDESPLFEQATNIRWRDGTIYQSFPTDLSGAAPYDEVFPFFNWLVAEVDYARFKATGVTVTVDAGGPLLDGEVTTPQAQSENGGGPNRTELGPVLTQAFQGFLGQTSVIEWGKKPYGPGENGGISGIVYYAITRAENDPRYAAAEPWEPGIPRIQISLNKDDDFDGVIDDLNGDGCPTPADVNNYPFDLVSGEEDFVYMVNPELACDFIKNPALGLTFSDGDAVQITTAGLAFPAGSPNVSVNQPAGIVAYSHSANLEASMRRSSTFAPYHGFSNPTMINNIIWHNRSFHFEIDTIVSPQVVRLVPDIGGGDAPVFADLGVRGIAGMLNPQYSILTDTTGYDASNISADPEFVLGFFNGDAGQTVQQEEWTTSIAVAPAFDEGGNFIDVRFGPHQPGGDYHLISASPAINSGDSGVVSNYVDRPLCQDSCRL